MARNVRDAAPRHGILINNAGVGDARGNRRESSNGFELYFAVNTVASVLLTRLLADRLAETARRHGSAQVVMVASAAQNAVDFDDLMLTRGYSGMRAYARSKLALVMTTIELAAALRDRGVTVNALHLGSLLDTEMVREGFGRPLGPAEAGAQAEEHLATAPELADVTGLFRMHGARQAASPGP
jgi:NAD(P)-dependent dehydrogenase (short-subunit alcohol dehydrogenase family)